MQIKGRKSGRIYLVPVNYRTSSDGISIMTYRRRQWWRNIRDDGEVVAFLRGKKVVTTAEVVTDDLDAIGDGLLDQDTNTERAG